MSGAAAAATMTGIQSCTVSSNWGSATGASPKTSISPTITVPGSNPGVLKFASGSITGTFQYSINGGAFTNVVIGNTITLTNGQTLQFKLTGGSDTSNVTITDNTTGATVGNCTINTT